MNRSTGRKLQILPVAYEESHQLDLLSFVSGHALEELSLKEKQTRGRAPKAASYHFHGNVDQNRKFSNFCIGKSNQFAVEAVKRFIFSDKSECGMLFLKASSGLGKSHILHAVANEMLSLKKIFYFSSPLMMSPLIDAFSSLKFYDILLIDDIEELEGNTELQKVFCQIMDFARIGKIKIIFTGAGLPKDLISCDERTKGKLSSALIHHIDEMNIDLAFDIVEERSTAMKLDLPEAVKRLVSNQLGHNVYGLESLLFKLKSASEIKNQKITMDMALEEIKVKKAFHRTDDFHSFLNAVAAEFQISLEELMSSVRKKEFALARHAAMFILKDKKRLNLVKIAELFERDHTSVMYGISRIRKQIDLNPELRTKIQSLI